MANTIIGRIHRITPTENGITKGGKAFTKRNIVLDCTRYDAMTGERGFDNFPSFDFFNEKCLELDKFQAGQVVSVSFDVVGSYYQPQDKYITNVKAYKIEPYTPRSQRSNDAAPTGSNTSQTQQPQAQTNASQQAQTITSPAQQGKTELPPQGLGGDDLPF